MGFNVIFLHRATSQKPFLHHINIEDIMLNSTDDSTASITPLYSNILKEYRQSKEKLLLIEYFSVTEYLHLLIDTCKLLNPFESKAIIFLAAAVSDFYLPTVLMTEHKIQSGTGDLELCLKPVPKLIKSIKKTICPDAFIVSFKLETDEDLVIKKAQEALKKYQHDLVISNCLATRKTKLILLDGNGQEVILKQGDYIEEEMTGRVIHKYNNFKDLKRNK